MLIASSPTSNSNGTLGSGALTQILLAID